MIDVIDVTGWVGGACHLFRTEKSAVVVDAGFGFSGARTAENIAQVLGEQPLDLILLSHSHYDHVLGLPYLRDRYPGAKVVASAYAAGIFARKGALATMAELDEAAAKAAGQQPGPRRTGELAVDTPVGDGDLLELADCTIRVMASPGHTNCCISFFFQEEELLAASETLGVALDYPHILPCFLSSHRDTLDSLQRTQALNPARLFLPHTGLIPDGELPLFFREARAAVHETAAFVLKKHHQGCTVEETVQAYRAGFFTAQQAKYQPEAAFFANARAMIPRLLQEQGLLLHQDGPA